MEISTGYYIVGEEGGHNRLAASGEPTDQAIGGAEGMLARQGRKGYLVKVYGDPRRPVQIEIVKTLNGASGIDPNILMDRIKVRAGGRTTQRGASNTIFRNG